MGNQLKLPTAWESALLSVQTYDISHKRLSVSAAELARQTLQRIEEKDLWNCQEIPVYPPKDKVFRALELTPPEQTKVVILGQDPYHGPGQADGLAFSVPAGAKIPPSLRNIFKELMADIGCDMPTSGDLTPWAKQGVLLLNSEFTVEQGRPLSHKGFWGAMAFDIIWACCLMDRPPVFIGWGKNAIATLYAARFAALGQCAKEGTKIQGIYSIASSQKPGDKAQILYSTHPSPFSASKPTRIFPAFIGSRPFSAANQLLVESGRTPIEWALP